MQENTVVAVTPTGPVKFNSLDAALSSAHVALSDPIYSAASRIDKTLIRGPGLETYAGEDPWPFLLERAEERVEPAKKVGKRG